MGNTSKITWKVFKIQESNENLTLLYEGNKINSYKYYEKKCKKLKPNTLIGFYNPVGERICSQYMRLIPKNEEKFKLSRRRLFIFTILSSLSIYLAMFFLKKDIFISNVSILITFVLFIMIIYNLIVMFRNRKQKIFVNI